MKTILLLVGSLLVATNGIIAEEEPNLDDPKVREKILKEAVEWKNLEERGTDGETLFYQAAKETPYTGWVKNFYYDGQMPMLFTFKDGKADGLATLWHKNGKKMQEGTYKDGKWKGLFTEWHDNGQKSAEGIYKDGKLEGLWTWWDEDGKVFRQTRYKDGKKDKE